MNQFRTSLQISTVSTTFTSLFGMKMYSFVLAGVFKKQLKNLKGSLKKCLDKRNEFTKSGAAASKLPKCKFFEEMAFLHEKTGNKPTQSNVNHNLDSPEISNLGSPPSISSFRYETKSVKAWQNPCQKKIEDRYT